ncbi:MAG: alpha/beta fold hydrolase [Chloroflexota bacterium]
MPNSSYVFANQLRIHYLSWNHAGERAPIVLHHGLASNAHIWDLVAPFLAQAGHPVFAIDARGHGLTDKPDQGYDLPAVTDDLAAFSDSCRLQRPLLVGHSWGALAVLHYAARFAIGPRAPAGVVLVDGGLSQMNDGQTTWEEVRRRLTPPSLAGMHLETFRRKLYKWNADWDPSETAIQAYLAGFEVDDEERITPRLTLERHLAILRSMWDTPTHALYARLRSPLLALACRRASPPGSLEAGHFARQQLGIQLLQRARPDAQVQVLDDTIHDVPLQRPELLARLVTDFAGRCG